MEKELIIITENVDGTLSTWQDYAARLLFNQWNREFKIHSFTTSFVDDCFFNPAPEGVFMVEEHSSRMEKGLFPRWGHYPEYFQEVSLQTRLDALLAYECASKLNMRGKDADKLADFLLSARCNNSWTSKVRLIRKFFNAPKEEAPSFASSPPRGFSTNENPFPFLKREGDTRICWRVYSDAVLIIVTQRNGDCITANVKITWQGFILDSLTKGIYPFGSEQWNILQSYLQTLGVDIYPSVLKQWGDAAIKYDSMKKDFSEDVTKFFSVLSNFNHKSFLLRYKGELQ